MEYDDLFNLSRAKAIDDGKWLIGYYVADECADKHYIFIINRRKKQLINN